MSKKRDQPDRTCTLCGGRMQAGFIPNFASGEIPQVKWKSGEPAKGFLGMIKTLENARPIVAYCCESCGHLDLFVSSTEVDA